MTILELYKEELDYLISQQADPFHLVFFAKHYNIGNINDEDLVELRGYYKGLKVAREALERIEDIYG